MPSGIIEDTVEQAALSWFGELGYTVLHGPNIAPGELGAERSSYADVVLLDRLRAALVRINPGIPAIGLEEAVRKVTRTQSPSLIESNRAFHSMLTESVDVEYSRPDGSIKGDNAWLVDFNHPANNDFLAVNQFTVIEGGPNRERNRRPDIVLFVNGMPLGVIELKNAADEKATIRGAFNQLQTYKHDIPSLFPYNEALVISDGLSARLGTLTSNWERFMPWRTIEGVEIAPKNSLELEVLIKGVFEPSRFLDLVRYFTVFEVEGESGKSNGKQKGSGSAQLNKKMAAYHQFHAANRAVERTVQAASPQGDKRIGVVWHTQGSGKSLSMVFYAAKIALHPSMGNPTLVVLTDRNDLDDQLWSTFASCQQLLRQTPVQAESRENLQDLLRVASGGIVFTTIQKFLPEEKFTAYPQLSDRRNIVVIADEAHRSQYSFITGFARHLRDALPNASFIGFTGTPIEADDRSTPAVFGEYIDIYDIQRAVEDGATVRIYYEGRLAKLGLKEDERPNIDPEFEEVTEGEEEEKKSKLRSKWARLEAMVGTPTRISLVAKDIVTHFEQRLEALEGKGMIVCMSRRICVDLYNAIVRLRPEWHTYDDKTGAIKVVMTGSAADPQSYQPHVRNKARREDLANRLKDPGDPLKLVIVRDMWLTGFDAPPLHTMYVDKPMRGHTLMQAIARVNRVFRDKPGGLIVDYLGLADFLRRALTEYTKGDQEQTSIPQEQAVAIMQEKYEIVKAMFHRFDYSKMFTGTPTERLALMPWAADHIVAQENGKTRYLNAVTALSRAFALSVPHERTLGIRDELAFFQAVRGTIVKTTEVEGHTSDDLDSAIQQLVSKAVVSEGIVDIFAQAGLKAPDVSIFSDEFLAEVRDLPQRNLAMEALRKLLMDQIRATSRKNVIQSRSFADMLETTIHHYQNRSLDAAQVITELIELAKQMRAAHRRGEELGLTEDELAFYDALETNNSAVKVLGDDTLRSIARELVETVRRNVTIDWTVKESARAQMRVVVKRLLRKYGYPPDKQERATRTILEQAEMLSAEWAA